MKSNENRDNSSTSIVKRKNRAVFYTIIIGILTTIIIMGMMAASKLHSYSEKMHTTIRAAVKEYEKNANLDEAYINSMKDMADSLAGFTAFTFHEKGYNPVSKKQLMEEIGDYVYICYYLGDAQSVSDIKKGKLFSDRDYTYGLKNDETLELLQNGFVEVGDEFFSSHMVDNNKYAIICWTPGEIFKRKSILNAYASTDYQRVYRINNETGIIEDSNVSDTIGMTFDTGILDYKNIDINHNKANIYNLKGIGVCLVESSDEIENQTLLSYIPLSIVRYDYLSVIILSSVLVWGFLIMILRFYLKYVSAHDIADVNNSECFHVFGKFYVKSKLIAHVIGLMIFGILTSVILVFYFQTLLSYSLQDTDANNDLNSFSLFLDNAQDNVDIMQNDYAQMQSILCEAISTFFLKNPDSLTQENLNIMNHYMSTVESITIYDKSGNVEYDTGNNLGYTLSHDESSVRNTGEHNLWSIIDGSSDFAGYIGNSGNDFYAACRRQDQVGAIVIKVRYDNVKRAMAIMSFQETLKTADFGYSSTILIDNNEPETLYIASPGEDEIKAAPNTFDEKIFDGSNSRILKYDGRRYFANLYKTFNYKLISATKLSDVYGEFNGNLYLSIVTAFLLQSIALILTGMFKSETLPEKIVQFLKNESFSNTVDNQILDKSFRNTLKKMIVFVVAIIGVQLILDSAFSNNPIITYLFSSKWSKGLNMFSLTMILIIITVGFFGGLIVHGLLLFFTKNMGPRGLTIGRMMGSLVRFLALFIVVVICVKQLGFEMSTIITGAGILGGLTLFCAQNTINDMLSGFFLVFENQFNIGDWITIDDFRGQVIEIGIRTTKLQKNGTFKVFNNSEIKKFRLEDYWDCGAIVDVSIAYKEDATRVIQLLKDSKDRFTAEIPQITEGPNILGVTELGESGVAIGIRALADVSVISRVEREIRRVTKHIFDENGIEIPFQQVTLHMGEELEGVVDAYVEDNKNTGD